MAVAGVVLFYAGRRITRKLALEKNLSPMPATILSARGIAIAVATIIAWAGAILAMACLLILLG